MSLSNAEKLIQFYMNKIFVMLPCKIEKLDGMYADVKPCVDTDLVSFPIIPSVPILIFGNNSKKLKFKNSVGDIVTVLFSQLDISDFLISGTEGRANSSETFNMTNAVALPFNIHKKANEAVAESDFDIIGDLKLLGNLEMIGDLDVTGNVSVTNGNITVAGGDVIADGISLKTHNHAVQVNPTSGTGATTGVPY